uniref:WAS/WASL interacting protein family member 3 n=1 Tax=Sphenodon punctatus TaxID=8508 RepID=A0A8D0GBE2_SPHPU
RDATCGRTAPLPPRCPPSGEMEPPKPRKEDPKSRSALLADIQKGTRLRQVTQIDDRSAPQIEKPKETNRHGGGPGTSKSGAQSSLGGLFAGGFPVLRPVGQREMAAGKAGQLPGARSPSPRSPAPPNNNVKTGSGPLNLPDCPKPVNSLEAPGTSRVVPARPSIPAPPPPPLPSGKPSLVFPPPPPLPPPMERPAKITSQNLASPPPPPPQSDKPSKLQITTSNPPLPPLPLTPPCVFPARAMDLPSSSPSLPDLRDCLPPTPPAPPPPLPPSYTFSSHRTSLPPPPPSPTFNSAMSSSDVPPPLPPKSPHLLSQIQKPNIQSMPLPPTPPVTQSAATVPKKRQGRGAGKIWLETVLLCYYYMAEYKFIFLVINFFLNSPDDFESKFTFHSVEEFPPPDEFKQFQKIYPSKESRGKYPFNWLIAARGTNSRVMKGRRLKMTKPCI